MPAQSKDIVLERTFDRIYAMYMSLGTHPPIRPPIHLSTSIRKGEVDPSQNSIVSNIPDGLCSEALSLSLLEIATAELLHLLNSKCVH